MSSAVIREFIEQPAKRGAGHALVLDPPDQRKLLCARLRSARRHIRGLIPGKHHRRPRDD